MKVAVIGTGISGNVAAYRLCREHDVTVYEANDYIGGHTHTHHIERDEAAVAVDSGFIVYNDRTYPHFVRLLDELGVETQTSEMSFSMRCDTRNLEYNGNTLNTLFAQRRNLFRPSFYRMIADIVRFNEEAQVFMQANDEQKTLGQFLVEGAYSAEFIDHYIIPMGAAIWSTDPLLMQRFPACYFIRFFKNHGLLSINDRPTWRVIKGGSQRYVEKLTTPFREQIRLSSPIESVRRWPNYVEIKARNQDAERYDAVFLACHSDEALGMLRDASAQEREILGAIPYQRNEAVLHTDTSMLPRRRLAWAAWNYHLPRDDAGRATLTYNMNILQGIKGPRQFLVTLNQTDAVDPQHIIKRMTYHHPLYTHAGVAAQRRHAEIDGVNRTYFCGAYWRYGFHEDGVWSALQALTHFEERANDAQLRLRRTG